MPIPSPKLKVLVVDDMLTYRAILTQVLKEFEWVEVSGTASNGQQALDAMHKKTADLILIDLEMPVMNGLQAVPLLRQQFPATQVVLISGTNQNSADLTLQALEAGAMDFIPKPNQGSMTANMEELRQKLRAVTVTCLEKQKHKLPGQKPQTAQSPYTSMSKKSSLENMRPLSSPRGFEVIAIGVSTGGPNALSEVIPALPVNLGLPILIVQHMPPVFTASLANMLDKKSALPVKEAEHNDIIQPNTVYIAPGGRHMKVSQSAGKITILLDDTPPVNSCRPAVDVLFQSLPLIYGKRVLSIILTGMGSDGLVGVRQIKECGGFCLTQSEESCVVYGMPRSIDEQGLSDEQVPLSDLATRIQQLVKTTKKDGLYVNP